MKRMIIAALLAGAASFPAIAQDTTLNSTSGSDATANSGSQSGAASDQTQGQAQTANNAGIGNSTSGSVSGSEAYSGSVSGSESNGNQQGQSQGQSANNDQGQSQGQSANNAQGQSSSNTNSLGQSATNQQGVQVATTFNTYNRKKTVQEFRTNTAVPLAASSSFSSDYCGGTASGGASAAPLGISIGAAAPTFDKSCQYLRLAEKSGMLGANYHNMQQPDMALKAMSLMAWATCMAGPINDKTRKGYQENLVMEACLRLGLLGSEASPMTPPPAYVPPPAVQQPNGYPTPEAVERYKTPRGDLQYESNPVVQTPPVAMASVTAP